MVHRAQIAMQLGGVPSVIALLATLAAWHWWNERDLRIRLLVSDPDAIARDSRLMQYALPLGRGVYATRCASCHGPQMRGDAHRGIPNLVDRDWLYGSGRVGEIERIVMYGIRAGISKTQNFASMPAFATPSPYARYTIEPLRPDEVSDVTELIYSFQHPQEVDPDAVRRGTTLFHGKGLCFDCHSDHANGDPAIGAPNLVDALWLYGDGSRDSLREAISRGLSGVCPQWITRLDPVKIRAVALFVHAEQAGVK